MVTITFDDIDREDLLKAILDIRHASGPVSSWVLAYDPHDPSRHGIYNECPYVGWDCISVSAIVEAIEERDSISFLYADASEMADDFCHSEGLERDALFEALDNGDPEISQKWEDFCREDKEIATEFVKESLYGEVAVGGIRIVL